MSFLIDTFTQLIGMIKDGGGFEWLIVVVWLIGLAVAVDKTMKLWVYDIDGASFMNEVQKYVLANDIAGAIKICSNTQALLPRVIKHGLKRAHQSEEQIQNAIDSTSLEVFPKIESRLSYLGLIANISTLLGLLGTIFGLISSFSAVAVVEPSQKSELLAKGIALAMNTTALGIISAVSILIFHTFLSAKADRIISSIDEFSVKLIDLLGTKKEE